MSTARAARPEHGETEPGREQLARIVADAVHAVRRLERAVDGGIDTALSVVSEARAQLERTERELVGLARRSGRSWAEIGAGLNIIIPRNADRNLETAVRYARSRHSGGGEGSSLGSERRSGARTARGTANRSRSG